MVDVDFRELVLTDGQLDGKEAAPPLPEGLADPAKAYPVHEVTAASFSDAVLTHRMDDHDEVLVFLMSRGQAYMRDGDELDPPRRLTAEELAKHLEDLRGDLQVVPWCSPLHAGKREARGLLSLLEDPVFQKLARSGQVIAEYGANSRDMEGRPMRVVVQNESKGAIKALTSAVADYVGKEGAAAALGEALGLWSPWTRGGDIATTYGCELRRYRDAVDVFSHPEAFLAIRDEFGLDAAREYLKGYLALTSRDTWTLEQASVEHFLATCRLLGVSMKPKAFLAYAIGQRRQQGVNVFDGSQWLDVWCDTLAMQDIIHGQVDDKYPNDLFDAHDHLIREAVRVRHAIAPEEAVEATPCALPPFEAHRQALLVNAMEDERYIIRPPLDTEEMLFEARSQRNCLASYVKAFEHGDTDIYLMRRADAPDVPCVTVEVRDGMVRQAYQAMNRDMTKEQADWLLGWCRERGIAPNSRFMPQCVDLHYEGDAAGRHGARVDTMAAARREDRLHNRPGRWRG